MRLSVVIPTWQEQPRIAEAVAHATLFADEVIVADAGSPDGTAAAAQRAGARVVSAPRGRGPQLDAGARAATGEVLVFLHADATLPAEARAAITTALSSPDVVGGNFLLRFEPASATARFLAWANDVRRRWFGIYYGDSALFVRRDAYEDLGGFRALPLFEDYDFVRRLERFGRTVYVTDVSVRASARRFAGAPLRTLGLWTLMQCLYSAGVSPFRLAKFYRGPR